MIYKAEDIVHPHHRLHIGTDKNQTILQQDEVLCSGFDGSGCDVLFRKHFGKIYARKRHVSLDFFKSTTANCCDNVMCTLKLAVHKKYVFKNSQYSEANASEFLKTFEEIFRRYLHNKVHLLNYIKFS